MPANGSRTSSPGLLHSRMQRRTVSSCKAAIWRSSTTIRDGRPANGRTIRDAVKAAEKQLPLGHIVHLQELRLDRELREDVAVVLIAEVRRLADRHAPGCEPTEERILSVALESP